MPRGVLDYRALRPIPYPGENYSFAFQPGQEVPEGTVENWGLEVGVDVEPARTGLRERPNKSASRADWEDYAIHSGVPRDEARELTRDELAERVPEEEPAQLRLLGEAAQVVTPAEPLPEVREVKPPPPTTAKKEDWVTYALQERDADPEQIDGWTKQQLIDHYGLDRRR